MLDFPRISHEITPETRSTFDVDDNVHPPTARTHYSPEPSASSPPIERPMYHFSTPSYSTSLFLKGKKSPERRIYQHPQALLRSQTAKARGVILLAGSNAPFFISQQGC
jgi:hypothetical protein